MAPAVADPPLELVNGTVVDRIPTSSPAELSVNHKRWCI